MPDKPRAEIDIDEDLVRRLVLTQAPDSIATLPLRHSADGWDCAVWRLGSDLAVRLPRRASAAPLILNEQRALPELAQPIEATGVKAPVPVIAGVPSDMFPWAWSIVPWFDGSRGLDIPRPTRTGWAAPLAAALDALHRAAPSDAPLNPYRGVPLAERAAVVAERAASLRARSTVDAALLDHAERSWHEALAAPRWSRPPVWIHGDLHPGNLIAHGEQLVGLIDFGDVTSGDPAYDLAVGWLAFDESGRTAFIEGTGARYDAATWVRARGWAAAFAITLIEHSDDNPDYAGLGRDALVEIAASK